MCYKRASLLSGVIRCGTHFAALSMRLHDQVLAGYCGHVSVCEWILSVNKNSIAERNLNGVTPLISAANGGHPGVVKLLLERGADIEECDHDGSTALILAILRGHLGVLQVLALNGAMQYTNVWSNPGILEVAFEHPHVYKWLRYTSTFGPLHMAAHLRDYGRAKALLRSGASPHLRISGGLSPAAIAATSTEVPGSPKICVATKALLHDAAAPWSPRTHWLFGPQYRTCVFHALWLRWKLQAENKSALPFLPTELWFLIIASLSRSAESYRTQKVQSSAAVGAEMDGGDVFATNTV